MLNYKELQHEIDKARLRLRWAMITKQYEDQQRLTNLIHHLKDCQLELLSPLAGAA